MLTAITVQCGLRLVRNYQNEIQAARRGLLQQFSFPRPLAVVFNVVVRKCRLLSRKSRSLLKVFAGKETFL